MNKKEQYRIKKRLGIGLRRFILRKFPSHKYEMIFGCDVNFLRAFIEYQFSSAMCWDNFTAEWQLDHLVPVCVFDQTDVNQLHLCWNWVNIRPLTITQNRGRNSYAHARDELANRKSRFPAHPFLEQLISITIRMEEKDEPGLVDWTAFAATNPYHVVWSGDEESKCTYDADIVRGNEG